MFSSAGLSKMEAGHKGGKEAADPLIKRTRNFFESLTTKRVKLIQI